MIRRIDLGSNIKEFDYDSDKAGTQGAYIYVPDEMRNVVPRKFIDSEGFFSAPICGFIPGPDRTVIALGGGGTDGSVAFIIDPDEEAVAFTPKQAIFFQYASRLCRGVYSSRLQKLYAIDVTRSGAKNGREGVFVADITLDGKGSPASYYSVGKANAPNPLSVMNFLDLALYEDRLFLLSGNGRFDADWDNTIYTVWKSFWMRTPPNRVASAIPTFPPSPPSKPKMAPFSSRRARIRPLPGTSPETNSNASI